MKMLNVGCGVTFHPDWVNIDLISTSPHVTAHDLRKGIPYPDGHFDVVYHSHVLEHMTNFQGKLFMTETLRVLKSGGTVRVVVPDLESIARCYLEKLAGAVQNVPLAMEDYDWIMLELFDQVVRTSFGGEMAHYLARPQISNLEFVRARIGRGADVMQATSPSIQAGLFQKIVSYNLPTLVRRVRLKLARLAVSIVAGHDAAISFEEGLFRNSGEIHKWMYDRFSLKRLLMQLGSENVQVCRADDSRIPDFARYELETTKAGIRKPDSIFVEGTKRG
jgi:predicted SAM-dependent methyltransferase